MTAGTFRTRTHRRGGVALPVAAALMGPTLATMALAGLLDDTAAPTGAVAAGGLGLLVLALGALAVERELRVRRALAMVDEERARSDSLAHEAAHDPLTGVLNRHAFLARLELALARARLHGRSLGLLFVDLDEFKQVNDVLGHDVGDRMLVRVAERLQSCVRSADAVGRFGGDEFVLLLEDLDDHERAFEVAERVEVVLTVPFVVAGRRLGIGASVGVTISVGGREAAQALVREADAAMYLAKRSGRVNLDLLAAEPDDSDDLRILAG